MTVLRHDRWVTSELWRLRSVVNWLNLSTPLGLLVARYGHAQVASRGRGLRLATGYRFDFPAASAFTIGSVVISRHSPEYFDERPELLRHEERHTWQYVACLGLPFIPLYLAAAGWSWLRAGDWASHNVFERLAGLSDGQYVVPTPDQVAAVHARRRQAFRSLLR